MDSDSDEEKREKELPSYKIRYNDMPIKLVKEVVRYANEAFNKFPLEKDIAIEIVRAVKASPNFKIGEGEWQCIVGRNFGCSLTFDAHVLTLFDLLNVGKSILLFKSG